MKKHLIKLICIFLFIVLVNPIYVLADDIDEELDEEITANALDEVSKNFENEPVINSRKAVIYDRESKRILYGKNENIKAAMASTTKIMTATIILEKANLNKEVTVTKKAAGTGGSRLGLKENDKITIRDLLYGLLMKSGNDAAVELAMEVGGSVENFANMMNDKAKELGLKNTHFVTPHGLDNPEHYTTAYELAKLTDYALENEKFKSIVGTKKYTITLNGAPKELNNTNELLGVLNGVIGVKTGFTNNAGRCLVTETKRNSRDLITIVLGADTKKDRTKDSIKLIEYGFSNFVSVNIEENANEEFENWKEINTNRIEIKKAKYNNLELQLGNIKNKRILIKDNEINKINYNINCISILDAPIEKDYKVGTLIIKKDEEIIEEVDIICKNSIKKKNCWDYFKENLGLIYKL